MVFLYEHLGLAPFDQITIGRYWMVGFILSGFLSFLYFVTKIIEKTIKKNKISWPQIIMLSSLPLIINVLFITMAMGKPKMPFTIAISSAATLICGLIIGFSVVDDLIKNFKSTLSYLFIGVGLVPFLVLFRALELPKKLNFPIQTSIIIVMIAFIFGLIWIIIFHKIFKNQKKSIIKIIKGTLLVAYIGLPVLHYIFATPKGIPYITSSDNLFPNDYILRIINWILLLVIVFVGDRLFNKKSPAANRRSSSMRAPR